MKKRNPNAPFDLKERTKRFAIRSMKLVDALPRSLSADVVGKQLLRSATSVGSNYRSACRGRSRAEFLSKLGIVEEEIDETIYWFELLIGGGLMPTTRLANLLAEANEIASIIVAPIKTARKNGRGSK